MKKQLSDWRLCCSQMGFPSTGCLPAAPLGCINRNWIVRHFIYIYIHRMCVYMYTRCIHACMHVCIYIYIYVCMYVCIYACIYFSLILHKIGGIPELNSCLYHGSMTPLTMLGGRLITPSMDFGLPSRNHHKRISGVQSWPYIYIYKQINK